MKIAGLHFDRMKSTMKAVVDANGGSTVVVSAFKDGLFKGAKSKTPGSMLWTLWWVCQHNLLYDDTHPAFVQGHWKRLVPQAVSRFDDLFPPDTNDDHVLTALKKIGLELGLLAGNEKWISGGKSEW